MIKGICPRTSRALVSGRGTTQDGIAKPDLVSPGAHIVAPLAPDSDFPSLCPTCIVDGRYFRIGGTSMAAPIVTGIVAGLIQAHPDWTPDQVKGALTYRASRNAKYWNPRRTGDGAWEVAADNALRATSGELTANHGLVPNDLVDPTTGDIDYTRASWSRAGWSAAADALRASWSRASPIFRSS
jgi:serine protease AprX